MPHPPLDRSLFPRACRGAYLNHAGVAPIPAGAVDAMGRWAAECGAAGSVDFDRQEERAEEVRALAGRLMGVASRDVAFVKNTTEGLGFVANGLDWAEGDRVVVPDGEFPSTILPWLALSDRGVVVDRVPPEGPAGALPVEAFARVVAAGPPPRVVVTSWVQFGRGWRTDLAALAGVAHDAGALLCVDVIQGLGLVPAELEAWGVDFAMADSHKWLLGPAGIGVLFVRESCLGRLRPLEPGWASVAHREEWDNLDLVWDDSARRLEGGSANMCGIYGMGASMELLLSAGVDVVWEHVRGVCDYAHDALAAAGHTVLSDRSEPGRSGIVTFVPRGGVDPAAAAAALGARGVVCSPRGGGLRISPHGYNTTGDVDRLIEGLGAL